MSSDLESAQSLADLQSMIEFDEDCLLRMAKQCRESGMLSAATILDAMAVDLSDLRRALIKCGVWEDETKGEDAAN